VPGRALSAAAGAEAEGEEMRREPTDRQRQALTLIDQGIRTRGFAPTVRELCVALGVTSTNAVAGLLKALRDHGYLVSEPMRMRTWRVTEAGREWLWGKGAA
jgi:repressor LexA